MAAVEALAAVEAVASAAEADLAVEDRREALAADRAPEALADRIIVPHITIIIPTDISGDPAGAGVGAGALAGGVDRTLAEALLPLSY